MTNRRRYTDVYANGFEVYSQTMTWCIEHICTYISMYDILMTLELLNWVMMLIAPFLAPSHLLLVSYAELYRKALCILPI